jgi:hypothetical protein
MTAMSFPGPSKPVRVEPIKVPEPLRAPERAPARPPKPTEEPVKA